MTVQRVAVISVVDDDESVRLAMSSLVRSLGYQVREFASAEAFLASPLRHETACLIADVQMPGMSGLDLQDALLARNEVVPMIFARGMKLRQYAQSPFVSGYLVYWWRTQRVECCQQCPRF
jgi:FixJ family two-component response regulator